MLEIIILVVLVIVAWLVIKTVMDILGIIIMIASWMLAGYLAGRIIRGKGFGPIGDAALGVAGGIVGSILLGILGLEQVGNIWLVGGIIVGTIGAIILIYVIRFFSDDGFAK